MKDGKVKLESEREAKQRARQRQLENSSLDGGKRHVSRG